MELRYAIIKVQEKCPAGWNLEPSFCCEKCENCKVAENYGDTKEQLIKKIAQVMLRKFLKGYLGDTIQPKLAKEQIEIVYKNYLELAKDIVEFLGWKNNV